MEFSFTLFDPRRQRHSKNDAPTVEVRPNGRILFNQKAAELLNQQPYCMLGYDAAQLTLGLLPLAAERTNAFSIRYAAKGASIGAKKFFRHFNITPEQPVMNTPERSGEFISITLTPPL